MRRFGSMSFFVFVLMFLLSCSDCGFPVLISSAAKKVGVKKASRKVLADKTNSTPVSGLVPTATKSERREGAEEAPEASSPSVRGEDALRSQVVKLNNLIFFGQCFESRCECYFDELLEFNVGLVFSAGSQRTDDGCHPC